MRILNYNGQTWTVEVMSSVSSVTNQPAPPYTQIVQFINSATSATYPKELPKGEKLEDLSYEELIEVLKKAMKQGN